MSYSHNQRRKLIRRFKRESGDKWRRHFEAHVAKVKDELQGPFTGTLEDVMKVMKGGQQPWLMQR